MDDLDTSGCILTGLADERLSRAISAIHEQPQQAWTIQSLADVAAMSRARFAHNFREAVGVTPLDYLTDWRLSVARTLLRSGVPVASVAGQVGYQNHAAFSRVFSRKTGKSPREWLTQDQAAAG